MFFFLVAFVVALSLYETDNLVSLKQLCAEEDISSELVRASCEVHESAVADGEAIFISCSPCLWICTFSSWEQVARSNTNCCVADDSSVYAVWKVWCADESFESVEAWDYAIANSIS